MVGRRSRDVVPGVDGLILDDWYEDWCAAIWWVDFVRVWGALGLAVWTTMSIDRVAKLYGPR